jgi:hypothetical protein
MHNATAVKPGQRKTGITAAEMKGMRRTVKHNQMDHKRREELSNELKKKTTTINAGQNFETELIGLNMSTECRDTDFRNH